MILSTANFVRYKLANATDAQLEFMGLSNLQRDKVLEKDMQLSYFKSDQFSKQSLKRDGGFFPEKSKQENKTVICFNYDMPIYNLMETSAHEIFHAACFWSEKNSITPKSKLAATAAFMGVVGASRYSYELAGWPGAITGGIAGIALTCAAMYTNIRISNYNEEKKAYRFGALFNPDFYDFSIKPMPAKPEKPMRTIKNLLKDYPTTSEINQIYHDTKQECLGGNILFPDGNILKEFTEWDNDNTHGDITGKLRL